MAGVAAEANVSKQTVYSHFGNKDDLFSAAIEAKCTAYNLAESVRDAACPAHTALLAFARGFSELLLNADVMNLHRLLISQSTPKAIRLLAHNAGPKKAIADLEAFLEAKHRMKELHIPDAHLAALQFVSIIESHLHKKVLLDLAEPGEEEKISAYINGSVDMFLRAYRA